MDPTQDKPRVTAIGGTERAQQSGSPSGDSSSTRPTVSDQPTRGAARKLVLWEETEGETMRREVPVGQIRLSAPRKDTNEDAPASPYRPARPAQDSTAVASTTSTAVFTTTTTVATTTTGTATTTVVTRNPLGSAFTGATLGMPALPESPGEARGRTGRVVDAQLFNDADTWNPTEEELIDIILDRDPEVLMEEESRMICTAARQATTLALEMLLQPERELAFHPYSRTSNRGWHEEHCPFLAAIDHSRPDNLRLLLQRGVRPGLALELVLPAMDMWVKDIFRQHDYMV